MDKIGNQPVYKLHTLNTQEICSGLTQAEGSAFLLVSPQGHAFNAAKKFCFKMSAKASLQMQKYEHWQVKRFIV